MKKISPHDHDLLECGARQEVPQSVQCGRCYYLRNLQHYDCDREESMLMNCKYKKNIKIQRGRCHNLRNLQHYDCDRDE